MATLTPFLPPIFGFLSRDKSKEDTGSAHQDSADPREISKREDLCSGGYNEAFIIHYWSSYSPRN